MQEQWRALVPMIESGVIRPPVGATYALEDFGQALFDMDQRKATGQAGRAGPLGTHARGPATDRSRDLVRALVATSR